MNFTQKVYYNNKPLILTNDRAAYQVNDPKASSYLSFDVATPEDYTKALHQLLDAKVPGVIVQDASDKAIIQHLGSLYHTIQAGGGVVYNDKGEILMIHRRGKWDLPKGKLDAGETIDECALREVSEETSAQNLTLGVKVCDTYHLYNEKNKNYLKHTTWFKMTSAGNAPLTPQAMEDIKEARWVNPDELLPYMGNTYEAIKDVLHAAGQSW